MGKPVDIDKTRILLMHCVYGSTHPHSSRAFWQGALRPNSPYHGKVWQDQIATSFSSHNILLTAALNSAEEGQPFTHIGIMHNDVVPENGWVDILMEEMDRTECDLISVVTPIKDLEGKSSTAIDSYDDPFLVHRRIMMNEVFRLPETFDNVDCGYPDRNLLINTSCFIMRFTEPWATATNEDGSLKLNITSEDKIRRREDGKWMAYHSPSDWHLSRTVIQLGGKVMATRKVKLKHIGDLPYTNEQPWGTFDTDKALEHVHHNQWIGSKDTVLPTENGSTVTISMNEEAA